ncbi:unnamed protein product [Spirodela intermedia]|uniref:Uncharacterized protein n=1 Tax=Spirodela intermedia TaxID=51605 RepID=A0A7I8LFM9_SPIIN|nr:unnamed protein product [Spirodela intermedia]
MKHATMHHLNRKPTPQKMERCCDKAPRTYARRKKAQSPISQ